MWSSCARHLGHGLDRVIFHNNYTTRQSRGLFRIVFTLFVLLVVSATQFGYGGPDHPLEYGDFPQSFFVPPLGPMILVPGFPHPAFFEALAFGLILALVFLLFGFYTRVASLAVALALLVFDGFTFSFGKIDHFLLFTLVPLVMAFSDWGQTYSLDSLRVRREQGAAGVASDGSWPPALMAMLLGLMYATAGLSKAGGGWLSLSTQAAQLTVIERLVGGAQAPLGEFAIVSISSRPFWESLDYITVVFEIGFMFAWLHRTSLRLFCAVAVLFHVANMLVFGINFTILLLAYALFVPWDRILGPFIQGGNLIRWIAPFLARGLAMVPLALGLTALLYFFGPPLGLVNRLALPNSLQWTDSPIDGMVQALVGFLVTLAGLWMAAQWVARLYRRWPATLPARHTYQAARQRRSNGVYPPTNGVSGSDELPERRGTERL